MLIKKILLALTLAAAALGSACANLNQQMEQPKKVVKQQVISSNLVCYDFIIKGMAGEWIKSLVVINGNDIGYKKAAQFLGDVDYISSEYDFEVHKGNQCYQLQKKYNPKQVFIYK